MTQHSTGMYFSAVANANMNGSTVNLPNKMNVKESKAHVGSYAVMDKSFYRSLSPVNFELASVSADDVTYKLFTEPNQKEGNVITKKTVATEVKNKDIPTVLIIHGWTTDDTSPCLRDPNEHRKNYESRFVPLKEALLKLSPHNVIFVNWQNSGGNETYDVSTANTKPVGNYIAEFLKSSEIPPANIHLIGTSLGAHLTSFIGRSVQELTGKKVGRITGLDPSGPKFCHSSMIDKLSESDAEFVDVIHSDIEFYGYAKPMGHVDFYPNGGTHQPGCPKREKDDNCSHARCTLYYIESLSRRTKAFEATYAEVDNGYAIKKKDKGKEVTFGHHVEKTARGVYFLETNSEAPFLNV